MKVRLEQLSSATGVRFGTSGVRGLATQMTDLVCYAYTCGFLQYLRATGELAEARTAVAVAGDLRPSTDRIVEAVCQAVEDLGHQPVYCGKVPSPALAFYGLQQCIPSIMVTGSHIPEDRNGIKFNKPTGEVLKADETGILQQEVRVPEGLFDARGAFARRGRGSVRPVNDAARQSYMVRYLEVFPPDTFRGLRLGVYEHSAVGRELLTELFRALGAEVTPLGRSDRFVPVDTEAIRPEDVALAQQWAGQYRFDAIVSADGDSDRPLLSDEHGRWVRGDVLGILCAKFLEADSVSTPITSNTALERCGWFAEVRRTRIGSPYVIVSMIEAARGGARRVVGYEANGGFLIQTDLELNGQRLSALPTRDAAIVLLSVLSLARRQGQTVSGLVATLPRRFTASDRVGNFPPERSQALLARFNTGNQAADRQAVQALFGSLCGAVAGMDRTDGLRLSFANGEIVHLRPSGNAPELRCYAEADTPERAQELTRRALELVTQVSA